MRLFQQEGFWYDLDGKDIRDKRDTYRIRKQNFFRSNRDKDSGLGGIETPEKENVF